MQPNGMLVVDVGLVAIGIVAVLALFAVESWRSRRPHEALTSPRPLRALTNTRRAGLLAAVVASFLLCLACAALQGGYAEATRGSATPLHDSAGHELGFNLPLTWELAGILLRRATPTSVLDALLGVYGLAYLAAHLVAVLVLTRAIRLPPRAIAVGWWLQLVIFPTGWLGLLMLPYVILDGVDGEGLTDVVFWWTAQPIWLAISALAGTWWWREARLDCARTGARPTASAASIPAP